MGIVRVRGQQVERETVHILGALALLEDEIALERHARRHGDAFALLAAPEGTSDGTQLISNHRSVKREVIPLCFDCREFCDIRRTFCFAAPSPDCSSRLRLPYSRSA
jgi:hypothetical protein